MNKSLSFQDQLTLPPALYKPAQAKEAFADFLKELTQEGEGEIASALKSAPLGQFLTVVFASSPYLTRLIQQNTDLLPALMEQSIDEIFKKLSADFETRAGEIDDFNQMMALLRQFKKRGALLIALADIGKVWPLLKVTGAVSDLADLCLQWAVRFLLKRAAEKGDFLIKGPKKHIDQECGYFILGMGKYGAFELNYSSDIDLIILFDGDVITLKEDFDPQMFCVRLTRELVKLMQEMTADGYVFRTDLRLRPDPGATQVAMSVNAAFVYYENFGQNWERAAMIKARPVAGDLEAGVKFLKGLAPYIWRKYLDFAAIADVHAMKRQIHAVKGHAQIALQGHDLKLGRGGIREIEFFVQTQQLIAGGRQEGLRGRETLKGLVELEKHGWIDQKAVDELTASYEFLRTIEHRLQMINDEQTHALPTDEDQLERIALFSGFKTFDEFAKTLTHHLTIVESHYVNLFEENDDLSGGEGNLIFAGDEIDGGTYETLKKLGFEQPERVFEVISSWHFGRYPSTRSATARERLTEFQPKLVHLLADAADPDGALLSFDRFLSQLPAGVQLFSLLKSSPTLLGLLTDIMSTAPRLADILAQKARLLDGVIDPSFCEENLRPDEIKANVTNELDKCVYYEQVLDQARITGREQRFLIGVKLLSGNLPPLEAGFAYSALAEGIVASLLEHVTKELALKHGRFKGQKIVVLGMGKLGGRELSTASDLDLIIIYDVDPKAEMSDGDRPLAVSTYFSRLTQRLIAALSAPTAEGVMYEVDMRLRPSGNSGPVATRFDSFKSYQLTDAWVWEHLALSRARVIAGDKALKKKVEADLKEILCLKRDRAKTAQDTLDMRERIFDEKGSESIWEIKQARGGLVEVEFITQFLQLIHGGDDPACLHTNIIEALDYFRQNKIITADEGNELIQAVTLYHNLIHLFRLCIEKTKDAHQTPIGFQRRLAEVAGEPDLARLELRLKETQARVAQLFKQIVTP